MIGKVCLYRRISVADVSQIYIDYYIPFFISYRLSALREMIYERGLIKGMM